MPIASSRRKTATKPKPATRAKAAASTARRAKAASTNEEIPEITVEDLADFNDSLNLMVYGDSGVGKTPFVGKAPRAVFVSTEKGSISAKRFGSKAKLIRATTWGKLEAALLYLQNNPDEFDWVILDSVTKMQVLLLRHLLKKNVSEGKAKADLDVPQIQDHQKWQNMFKRFIDEFVDLEVNTLFIAQAMHKEDAEGDDLVLPQITGKDYEIAQYVCAQMDSIFCLKVEDSATAKKGKRPRWKLLTQAFPPYFAKDRFDALDRVIFEPDIVKIIKAIEESADEKPNPNVAKRRAKADLPEDVEPERLDDDDEDEDDDWEDEEEEPKPAPKRRGAARKPAAKPVSKRRAPPPVDDDDDDEDEDDWDDEDEVDEDDLDDLDDDDE